MSRFFKLTFPGARGSDRTYQMEALEQLLEDVGVMKHPFLQPATSLNALIAVWSNQTLPPGKQRRKDKQEQRRRVDQEKVEMMISKYFSDKMVLEPPSTLAEFKEKRLKQKIKAHFTS